MASTAEGTSLLEEDTGVSAGDRVVISGMSGLYPNARHVADLSDILYNKVNPVTSENCRWVYNHPEVTQCTGKVPNLEYFDAQFFKVHYRLGHSMDAMGRKILEQAYQAIYDAGVSPEHLSGRKVGVYIGTCFSETEKACFYVASSRTGFGIAGCSKTMFANRISYWLNAKGPSMSVDEACCSSTAALNLAYQDILRGECEAAIVGGTNLCLHPQSSIHYGRIMKLSMDGKTKSFDENAEGCAKSEAINVLFLQRAKDALRVYAEVVHIKREFTSLLNDEAGPRYGFYRNPTHTVDFLKSFYEEAKVSPLAVEYVEACGSAVPEADKAELEALEKIFCNNRRDPLLVGSVMSNVGYGEAASGITAITKVLLGYHTGVLAGNLHCERPRRDVAALREGRMRVLVDHERCGRSYTAVNGLSVTGVNTHVLLNGRYKPKDLSRYQSAIPHLVLISGRQESGVNKILDDLQSRPVDPEELALLNNIHLTKISGNLARGYTILSKNKEEETVSLCKKVEYFDYVKRPLWFVYSGMGSQWAGMGVQLMRIPIFAAAIERCHRVLQPKGVDIVHIITSPDKSIFDNILHSFVGIAAIQIGLTDILRALGLVPDKIIGHSVGELGCAYADGCFTAEEMILSAYSRGLVSVQTPFIRGSMAAVGIGYQQVLPMCPPAIEVACHNGPDSCTISGPEGAMREFVAELVSKNIFAKEVPCSHIAYHSRYIAEAGPGLLKYLKEVIKSPKPRSERWVSTSVPMERWDEESTKYSSAEYHTNNLLNSVLFEETSRLIPADAVLVEVAPHGLLQAILKRSLPQSCRNIPITRRGHADNAVFLLDGIGKLYMEGFDSNIQSLYPKIDFPVSTGTPMLSHLVEWAHHEKWSVPLYLSARRKTAAATTSVISIHDDEHSYLQGHVIRGQILYPFAASLVAVWDAWAMSRGLERRHAAVQFRDVHLHVQPLLHSRRQLRVSVAMHRATGRFEVTDDINSRIASGFIIENEINLSQMNEDTENKDLDISAKDIYNIFSMIDVSYRDYFQSIQSTSSSLTEARISWRENWVAFIDGIFQLNALRRSQQCFAQPEFISKLVIDPNSHKYDHTIVTANISESHNTTRCGGVLLEDIKFRVLPTDTQNTVTLRALKFIPHFGSEMFDFSTISQVYSQIVSENLNKHDISIVGFYENVTVLSKLNEIKSTFDKVPGVKTTCRWIMSNNTSNVQEDELKTVDLVITSNLGTDDKMCQILYQVLPKNTFIMNIREPSNNLSGSIRPEALFQTVCRHNTGSAILELCRWRTDRSTTDLSVATVRTPSDLALLAQKQRSLSPHHTLLVLTNYPAEAGLKALFHKFREMGGCKVRLVMCDNNYEEGQYVGSLINVDLVLKIVRNGVLGGMYYVPVQNDGDLKIDGTLHNSSVGQLEFMDWISGPRREPCVKVKVHYAGLNDLDAKRSIGLIPFSNCHFKSGHRGFGMDFSGVTESGARVMGLVDCCAVSSQVDAIPDLLWPVPEHWSLEDAATVPLAYCLAYYCLYFKYKLYPGMRILVHGGAGALGQAVISIALANDCEVFTTVGDIRKKRFLLKMFPELKAENIGNSRDLTFCDMILNATNGRGVDINISGLNGELRTVTLNCLGYMGANIDVGLIPNNEKYYYGMNNLNKERCYIPVNLSAIFDPKQKTTMQRLQRVVGEGVARGWVRPLSRVQYAPGHAARAFRLLHASSHRGRALLRLADAHALETIPRLQCTSEKYHVIISDHETFGQQLADKLVQRGARKIRLYQPLTPKDFKFKMRQWQSTGVRVDCEEFNNTKSVLKSLINTEFCEAVQGIYIIRTNQSKPVDESTTFIEEIDVISRKLFPNLRYFAVINTVDTTGEETCVSRAVNRLPGTMIKLPELKETCIIIGRGPTTGETRISIGAAVETVERALLVATPLVDVHMSPISSESLLTRLAAVAEVNITEDTRSLSDMGMDPVRFNNVRILLRDVYNTFLTKKDIQTLTKQRIKDIDETLTRTGFDYEKGLNKIFSYVDSDELLATTEMVFLPTLTSNATMRDDEFVSETYLCIVGGVEGHHGRFRALCERLKLPALVLQAGLDRPKETLSQLAQRYVEILLKKDLVKKPFYLLGYESGVMVALEMAGLLEERGYTGIVYCIGVPIEIKTEIKTHLAGLETEEALQDDIVRHMFELMTNNDTKELALALQGVSTWQEKVNVTVRMLLGRVSHSAQYARQLIEAAYERVRQLLNYEIKPRALRSQLVLLRPSTESSDHTKSRLQQGVSVYPLQACSQQPVVEYALQAPLADATQDLRCAAIVNRHLDAQILKDFENRNLCESYLLNADSFMTRVDD